MTHTLIGRIPIYLCLCLITVCPKLKIRLGGARFCTQGLHFSSDCPAKALGRTGYLQATYRYLSASEKGGGAGLSELTLAGARKKGVRESDAEEATTGHVQSWGRNTSMSKQQRKDKWNKYKSMSDKRKEMDTRKGPQGGVRRYESQQPSWGRWPEPLLAQEA